MKIPVTLNGEKTVLEAQPYEKLANVLRSLGLLSVKTDCGNGACGNCAVLLDEKPVPSCIVPVAIARDSAIVTLEYFTKSEDFGDIAKGFGKAGIRLCGRCDAGKIFAAWNILNAEKHPDRKLAAEQTEGLAPCCTDAETLCDGILYAFDFKARRLGAKNAK